MFCTVIVDLTSPLDQPKKNSQKRPLTCQSPTFQSMNSSYYNYQTMPNQTKLARNLVWNNRFYLQELLLLLFFYLGPIWIFFCTKFKKKTVLDSFEYQKQKNMKFSEHHLKVEDFSGLFCFLKKKIWGDPFWDICPSSSRFSSP